MGAVDCAKLGREFEELRADSDSSGFRATLEELEKFVMPRIAVGASTGTTSPATPTWRNPERWDSTAPRELAKLAAHLLSAMVPQGVEWFSGTFPTRKLRESKEAKEWIEGNARSLWQGLEESDFQSEVSAALQEYLGNGNTFVSQEVEEGGGSWKGLDYTSIPVRECEFVEDSRGGMLRWYRLLSWTAHQCVDKWGPQGVPEKLRQQVESGHGLEKLSVLWCVFDRPEIRSKAIPDLQAVPELRPWGGVYFLLESREQLGVGEDGKPLEYGYYDPPVFKAGCERMPGSRWCQGFGQLALPPARAINAWVEMELAGRALALMPPIATTDEGFLPDTEIGPSKVIPVTSLDAFKVLELTGRLEAGKLSTEELRAELRAIFRTDQLDLKDTPQMTALEAQLRYDNMLRLLGPPLGRLQSEFFDQMLLAAYRAMFRAGRFPKPPQIVVDEQSEFSFVYLGPTARARKLDLVASHERGASYVAGLRKMGFEEVKHVFRPVQSVREVFDALGIPSVVLASEQEVKRAQQAEAELAARIAKAEADRAEGEAVEQDAAAMAALNGAGGGAVEPSTSFPAAPAPLLTPVIS